MRTLIFPDDYSVGELLICGPKEQWDWQNAIEARGTINAPDEHYVSLWISNRVVSKAPSFYKTLIPGSIDEFIAASSFFNDSEFVKILHLTDLDRIEIWETEITDKTLRHLPNFSRLRVLGADSTAITNDGLRPLGETRSLRSLSLYHTRIGDKGISYLIDLPLTTLDIRWTDVSDDSVKYLERMTDLKYLGIRGTKISKTGYIALQRALPKCNVAYYKNTV
jgi:Leucine Rich repeat